MPRKTIAASFLNGYELSAFFLRPFGSRMSRLRIKDDRTWDTAMPERIHMTGASTSMRRTITPWTDRLQCTISKQCGSMYRHIIYLVLPADTLTILTATSYRLATHSKVDRCDSIQNDENVLVSEFRETEIEAS